MIAVVVMAATSHPGWDARVWLRAVQSLRNGVNPYAAGIAAHHAFHNLPAASQVHAPLTYNYSPLTLPLLRSLVAWPDGLLAALFWSAVAAGFFLQLWAGFQMAGHNERAWLALLLPAVAFFPGLITDDVILSGNVAYILYGLVLAAAVPGWKRGRWIWYYLAVLVASIYKAPFLTLLAFPIVVGRRQWLPAGGTAAAGLLIFSAQARLWPELFREYLQVIRLLFDDAHDFGYGPAGVLGRALWNMGRHDSPVTSILYVTFAGALGIVLLFLARRVRQQNLPREAWIPIALVGTLLLNPRIMKYDLAAITIPMLLISWRTLRYALRDYPRGGAAPNRPNLAPALIGATCFLIPNLMTVAGPVWLPVELAVLLATFAMGIWSLNHSRLEQSGPYLARVAYEGLPPFGNVGSDLAQ